MTRIVYNRIAKAGSTTLTALIIALSKINNFTVFNDPNFFPSNSTLHHKLVSLPDNSIYINHCNYVANLPDDFVWINMIREPISRAESMFYYEVSHTRKEKAVEAIRQRMKDPCGCPYDEFDQCSRKRALDSNCAHKLTFEFDSNAAMYFSEATEHGTTHQHTLAGNVQPNWTTDLAFDRIREKYLFVGLSEEFELSVQILEQLLPTFFRGASEHYRSTNKEHHSNHTPMKNTLTNTTLGGAVSTFVRDLLTHHNAGEMTLYEKVQRLFWWKVAHILPNEVSFGTSGY